MKVSQVFHNYGYRKLQKPYPLKAEHFNTGSIGMTEINAMKMTTLILG